MASIALVEGAKLDQDKEKGRQKEVKGTIDSNGHGGSYMGNIFHPTLSSILGATSWHVFDMGIRKERRAFPIICLLLDSDRMGVVENAH